jgi:glycosyltransferase involved in cell wall biosynthesis
VANLKPLASKTPGLSIVVPTKGRVDSVRLLLESLAAAATNFEPKVECIIVDDSEGLAARSIEESCSYWGARYVRGPQFVGAKRNLGVALALADIVLFIDSDVQVSTSVLKGHWEAHLGRGERVGAVAGPTFATVTNTILNRAMRQSPWLNDLEWPRIAHELGWATTSNLSVNAQAFQTVGRFDEDPLTVVAGEDVDFGLRLTDAGWRIVCEPAAEAFHGEENSDDLRRVLRRLYTYGRSGQWLCTVHSSRRRLKANRVTLSAAALILGALFSASRGQRLALITLPNGIVGVYLTVARTKKWQDLIPNFLATTLELSAETGEFIAAWQLKKPSLMLYGFGWTNSQGFKWHTKIGRDVQP